MVHLFLEYITHFSCDHFWVEAGILSGLLTFCVGMRRKQDLILPNLFKQISLTRESMFFCGFCCCCLFLFVLFFLGISIKLFWVGQWVLCFFDVQEVFILFGFSVDPAEKKSESFSVIGR